MTRRTPALLPAALVALLALSACSPGADPGGDSAGADDVAVPHGYVEGARELQEPQLRLVALDGDVLRPSTRPRARSSSWRPAGRSATTRGSAR